MIGDRIIYFFECYYLVVGIDETFEEVMKSFIKKESRENVQETLKEIKLLLDEKNAEYLQYILDTNNEVKTSKEVLLKILDNIYKGLKVNLDN